MKSYIFLLFTNIIQAITVPANIDWAKIDEGTGCCDKHIPVMTSPHIVVADSSIGQYTMWTQMQECLAYNPTDGYIQFVCRNFMGGSVIDVWQSDKNFSVFLTDIIVQQLGSPRYPHSIASPDGRGPHLSVPCLVVSTWGLMVGQYESGGWFSSIWNPPVDVGPGDVDVHKCIGKQLPNGNILFIGITITPDIIYRTRSVDLSQELGSGVVAPGPGYYFGFDINGGIACVFFYDANLNVYYRTTTDGIDWSPIQTYNIVWPTPFTNNVLRWCQMAVTDAGNPILVFDMRDGDDQDYPWVGKVYVSVAPGQPCIEVGNPASGAVNNYPTIAAGGNYVVVLFGQPRSGSDSNTVWDIYYNYSTNNGVTWSTPRNLTSGITNRNNCLWQIAKRLDTTNGQFFFVSGCAIAFPMRDISPEIVTGSYPSRWYVGRSSIVGIAENKAEIPNKLALNIAPNPVRNYAGIIYALPKSGNVSLTLYTADGRHVKTIDQGYKNAGFYHLKIYPHKLANGVYIVVLKTENKNLTGKLVIAR